LNKFRKTAIAVGVAQLALLYGGVAVAQTTTSEKVDKTGTQVVVVTAQRAALQSAQKIKQDADEVVDSIVAVDIGKLPDQSVTEVLSRVVGVTMDRSNSSDPQHYAVEGSGIVIRGLPYVGSELNGRESFSAGSGHALSFSDVPPELMAGVDVYKNPSAEQIEGGISGLVNLRTALPFDFKGFKGTLTGSEAYSKLRKGKAAPSSSLLLSNRWTTRLGEFGVLVDIAKSKSKVRNDEMFVDPYYPHVNDIVPGRTMWVPKGAEWRQQAYDRDRKGDYAAFQWRPNRNLTASLTYFRSRYTEDWSERAIISQAAKPYDMKVADGTWDENGAFLAGTLSNPKNNGITFGSDHRASVRHSSTQDISLNVQWRVNPAWTVVNDFQRMLSHTDGIDSDVSTQVALPSETVDLTGRQPSFTFAPGVAQLLADPANYYWAYTQEHMDRKRADSKAWKTDVKYAFDDPVLRDVRFGVRMMNRRGENQNTNPSYNWQGITEPYWVGSQLSHLAYLNDPRFSSGAQLTPFPNFFNGDVQIPSLIYPTEAVVRGFPDSYTTLHSYHDILCAELQATKKGVTCSPWTAASFKDDPASVNRQGEHTRSAYAQLRFGFDNLKYPVDGNIGLRYVKTSVNAAGFTVFKPKPSNYPSGANVIGADMIPDIPGFVAPIDYKNSYHNLLPSLNLRMKAGDKLQFRFAAAKSMSRPDFNQLQGYTSLYETVNSSTTGGGNTGLPTTVTVNGVSLTGSGSGNPRLRPIAGVSEDLTAEWYFAKASSLTLAVFNKSLKDIIVNEAYRYPTTDVTGAPQTFIVTGPVNGAYGYARGVEIAYHQFYDFVPEWLRGIGTQASLTLVNSKRLLDDPSYQKWCSGGDGASNLNLAINGCDTNMQTFGNLPLQGVSKKTINLAVMYEHGPLQARLAYNWRSRFLLGVNNWGTRGTDALDLNPDSPTYGTYKGKNNQAYGLPLWQESYGQLDGSIFFKLTPKFRIGLSAQNLNSAMVKQTMVQHVGTLGHAWFVTGPRYSMQASYDF